MPISINCRNAKISNGRLPHEDGSDRRETSGKRVSDDLQLLIFRRQKLFWRKFFKTKLAQNQLIDVLKELRWFERHRHVRRQKLLPVVRLFSLYDPW